MPRAKADLISTEDMMRAAGIRIATSQVSIRAEAAGTAVGRLLDLPARAPVLVLRRNAIGADGIVKEVEPRLVLLRRLRAGLHRKSGRPKTSSTSAMSRSASDIATQRPHRGSTHETTGFSAQPHLRRARCAIAAQASASAQGAPPITVRFTVQPKTLVTTLVELAVEKGFFKEAGIDARTVTVAHGPAAVTALASGSVDVATNAPEVFLALAGKGQSLKLIAGQTPPARRARGRAPASTAGELPRLGAGAEGQEDRRHRAELGHPVSLHRDAQLRRARCDRRGVHRGRHRRAAGARRRAMSMPRC